MKAKSNFSNTKPANHRNGTLYFLINLCITSLIFIIDSLRFKHLQWFYYTFYTYLEQLTPSLDVCKEIQSIHRNIKKKRSGALINLTQLVSRTFIRLKMVLNYWTYQIVTDWTLDYNTKTVCIYNIDKLYWVSHVWANISSESKGRAWYHTNQIHLVNIKYESQFLKCINHTKYMYIN